LIGKVVAKDMTICKDRLEEWVGQEEWWWEEKTKSFLGLGNGNLLTAEIRRLFNDAVRNRNYVRLLAICVEGDLNNLSCDRRVRVVRQSQLHIQSKVHSALV